MNTAYHRPHMKHAKTGIYIIHKIQPKRERFRAKRGKIWKA